MTSARAYGLALAVALAASAASLANGFVYDDVPVIRNDTRIHSLAHLPSLVGAPFWPRSSRSNAYRPATTVAFALDWAIGGGRPLAFHLTNVALNLGVVSLVLALALRVLPPGGAVVAALWFAVQPVHVESVANGVGLAELLAAAAYLAALLAYLADGDAADAGVRGGARRAWLAAAVLASAALAYGAKEHAITLPATLALADVWRARGDARLARARFRRHAVLWLGVVTLAIGYLAARAYVLGPAFSGGAVASGLKGESVLARALIMAPGALVWLRWMIWPVHLSADYLPNHFVPSARLGLAQVAGFAVVGAIAVAAWRARRTLPGVTAGIVFTAVTASVTANIVVPTGVLLAERLAYLPSVGVAIVAGALWERLPRGRYLWPATALALALLAARTIQRIPVWHDPGRFLSALERDAPDSYRTHWARGQEAFEHGRRAEGEREMQAAIRIFPGDPQVLQELGERYLEAGLFHPAASYFLAAYELDSSRTDAEVRGAFALLKGGQPDSAAAVGTAALRRDPEAAPLLLATETAELAAGRP
ncbi:MAG: hypothetical protein B7Z72_04805, partial [Gemmatimonadetes bacterium 21-71-4]